MLLQVYPRNHQWHKAIFYDTIEGQYYNARTDIYLCEDDVLHHKLRPIELVDISTPYSNDYFLVWSREGSIRNSITSILHQARTAHALTQLSNDVIDRIALEVTLKCKSLCPTQIWSSQSDASIQTD